MGGFGSGERSWKKTTVEQCRSLDAARLSRQGVFARRGYAGDAWRLTWTNALGDQVLALVYWLEAVPPDDLVLHLDERVWPDGRKTDFREAIPLAKTQPNFGGWRWWFACPLSVDGIACGRRVQKLYLPPGERYFGCRSCHDLTYRSAQEHDRRVDELLKNPRALKAALESKNHHKALLALKACVKVLT